jgi:indolepyruvate ferredoxin oxidoreductase
MVTAAATAPEFSLDARYTATSGTVLLSGMQAIVRLLLDQRRFDRSRGLVTATFVSGYPGSPLAGLDLTLGQASRHLADHDIRFEPGLNEELAATAVWGSQQALLIPDARHDGVVGVWFGKAPGLDRARDAIRHANTAGVAPKGGAIAIVGDDPSSKSSSVPSRSEADFLALSMPVLSPGSIQDILDFGIHAVELSRASGLWVGFQVITDVADSIGTADVDLDRIVVERPASTHDGRPWQPLQIPATINPLTLQAEQDIVSGRLAMARRYATLNGLDRITHDAPAARVGIVAAGKTYRDVLDALDRLGLGTDGVERLGCRVLKLGMLWPLDPDALRSFARGLERILVVEEKQGFVETQLKAALYGMPDPPEVIGKRDGDGRVLVPADGQLDSERVAGALARVLDLPSPTRPALSMIAPSRTPFYCSGCPHSRSTVVPEGSIAGGGIGCHGMALRMFPETVGITQMGGEGAQWIGRAPYATTGHIFQNLGDGTFTHSGSLAIRACVASGVNITFKVLYNGAIAMTGGQQPAGSMTLPELVGVLTAERVARIAIVSDDPDRYPRGRWPDSVRIHHRDRLDAVQRELRDIPGVTVLVYDQECAAELRRKRRRGLVAEPEKTVVINAAVCEGCGDCGAKSRCLSVIPLETEFGTKTRIQQSSCNRDYSCLDGDCPSFVTITGGQTKPAPRRPVPALPGDLPAPASTPRWPWNLFIAGIGGTGVVTVNHVLATAALLDGRHVSGLDQTGLSQKAGPVVSHLRISDVAVAGAPTVPEATTDTLLAFDLLVAADPRHLARASAERTDALVSTSKVETGAMVGDAAASYPDPGPIVDAIRRRTRAMHELDAVAIAERLFGDHLLANIVVVGAAFQAGFVPLSEDAIDRALVANGVAVETNRAAFAWGRAAIAMPERLAGAMGTVPVEGDGPRPDDYAPSVRRSAAGILEGRTDDPELAELLGHRVPELIDYQGIAYARRYLELVDLAGDQEKRVTGVRGDFALAVARYFFKLLAYKDEYEVARLHLQPAFERQVRAHGGRVTYLLHPPFLRALGVRRKIGFGSWFRPVFRLLRAMRRLRGTPLDPFGIAHVRRVERELIQEYEQLIRAETAQLSLETHARAIAVARLPDLVRGYEEIKLRNVAAFRAEVVRLQSMGASIDA